MKASQKRYKGPFNNYVDKMRGGGGQKMSVFVHAQGIKIVHAGPLLISTDFLKYPFWHLFQTEKKIPL